MQAAIERKNGEIVSQNFFAALLGFRELGYEVSYFEQGSVSNLPARTEIVVVGTIPSVKSALSRCGVEAPCIPSIPPELLAFTARKVWDATLGEVRHQACGSAIPLFIKPVPSQTKLFTGHVVGAFRDLIQTAGLPDSTPVVCSDVVKFKSEYRCFVHRNSLIGCKHYGGSFRIFPDLELIDRAIEAYHSSPVAYALDMGVVEDGRTLLIEVNDAYALGSYGLEPSFYARMLADRWAEIVCA